MARRCELQRALLGALLAACACGCLAAPPVPALSVRHPERKCALVWFSGCSALFADDARDAGAAGDDQIDEDAGYPFDGPRR